jgi:CubicO group peptidase (beta-lactamase class C family)
MAPAGQLWSTVEDLARYAAFLAEPNAAVIAPETLEEMTVIRTGRPADALAGAYGLGFRMAVDRDRTYVGHTGSMPGFLAGIFVDRKHKTAAVALANGYAGLRAQGLPLDLMRIVEESEPSLPEPWIPNDSVDPRILDVLGVWYFGNDAFTFWYDGKAVVAQGIGDASPANSYRFEDLDRFVGVSGYHLGETLNVVRRSDGSVGHLECATFIFTRTPYDPDAPIPGR